MLLSGCIFMFCSISTYTTGQPVIDSATLAKKTKTDSLAKENVYKNPHYFDHIPVEKADGLADTAAIKASFSRMKAKYQSDEFNYDEHKINRLSWWERLRQHVAAFLSTLLPHLRINLKKVFYYFLIAFGLLAVAYVIYRIVTGGKNPLYKESAEKAGSSPDWIEKNLMNINLQTHLEEALSDNNFPLAIRYLHLINLKKLAETGQIEWDVQKTNHDFLNEIKSTVLKDDFAETIKLYEYVWYGGFGITESQFKNYSLLFKNYNDKITSKKTVAFAE